MHRQLLLISALFFVLTASVSAQSSNPNSSNAIPDVILEVTVRQKEQGKLAPSLHIMKLVCSRGKGTLISVSLNRCGLSGSGNNAFHPKIQWSSTEDGTLQIVNLGDVLEVKETSFDLGGESTVTHRFGFAKRHSQDLLPTRVTSYSGGFVKNSAILQKVITVEYVPLIGEFNEVNLDCQTVLLPGVDNGK